MTNTKLLRKFFNYTQLQLAELLGVSRSTVAMWENTQQEPDYGTVNKMSMIFNVPSDFIMNSGIFKKWDQIKEYYELVVFELKNMIPPALEMPSFSEDHTLLAWLDTRLYFEPDELQLVRWFSFAVKDIYITPKEDTPSGEKDADIEITFTPEFKALIAVEANSGPLRAVEKAPLYSSEALKLATDYDSLDSHGKRIIRLVADEEKERCTQPTSAAGNRPMIQAAARSGDVVEIEAVSLGELSGNEIIP